MAAKTYELDIAEHLNTPDDIRDFLNEIAETGDDSDFIHALGIAARAKGMSEVASQAGVARESLYKSLSEGGNPRFSTISKITKALGLKIVVA